MAWIFSLIFIFGLSFLLKKIHEKTEKVNKKQAEFLSKNKDRKTLLLITAHPDDESMFFIPTIENFKQDYKIHLLCFSNGNADGIGKVREKELEKVASFLGITTLKIIDNGYLKDGMKEQWDAYLIRKIIEEYYHDNPADIILTFDQFGISAHPNHIAVSNGTRAFCKEMKSAKRKPLCFELVSVNIFRKYIGFFDLLLCDQEKELTLIQFDVQTNWKTMQLHYSQFVWFRKLFVFFSRYTFINTLREYSSI